MLIKGVRPRTHLLIDSIQLVLLVTLASSAFITHNVLRAGTHLHFHFHALHELSGIALCVTVGLHLLLHLPWIQAQLTRLVRSQP
jgi:uncharacterized membrane protein (UPF0182 family)